jgi:hypothetical protein
MASLLEAARAAVERVKSEEPRLASRALFQATWSVSLAAGFLDAFAILDPSTAGEMFAEFAAVAGLTQRLRVPGDEAPEAAMELEVVGGRRRRRRRTDYLPRVTVRRVLPDRRLQARRQLNDRRRAASA